MSAASVEMERGKVNRRREERGGKRRRRGGEGRVGQRVEWRGEEKWGGERKRQKREEGGVRSGGELLTVPAGPPALPLQAGGNREAYSCLFPDLGMNSLK